MNFHRSVTGLLSLIFAIGFLPTWLRADPVTGWLKDTSFGGPGSVFNAGTDSPILGNGSSNNADDVAIYAAMPLVSLAPGQRVTLTGSAELIGTSSSGDFRWGLFKDNGIPPATGGWLGYIASAESTVWSKDPAGGSFTTATFASVAAGRGAAIGQMSEPNGIAFVPGTYDLRMTVERFGDDEVDVHVAISNDNTGFSIVTPSFQESNPTRLTFEFDRVGFLAGSALNADQIRFSGIDVTASAIEVPALQVRDDGLVRITNAFSQTFDLTAYEITSSTGSLNAVGWNSLDDQEGADPLGNGWEKASESDSQVLAEVNLLSMSSLENGDSLNLGHAFTPGGNEDLVFRFATSDGQVQRGLVEYVPFPDPTVPGDFDGDGDVDGPDFVVWQTNFPTASGATLATGDADGDGDVDGADFVIWQTNFPTTPAPAAAVPEPDAWSLLLSLPLWFAMLFVRRAVYEKPAMAMVSPREMSNTGGKQI